MAKGNSKRRNSAFDLTKPEYTAPQTRLEANRWLDKAQFGAATAYTDIPNSTKLSIVAESGSVDDATRLMSIGYSAWVDEQLADDTMPKLSGSRLAQNWETYFATGGNETGGLSVGHILYGNWFNALAVHGSSKLRLKSTFALSQIFALRQVGTTGEVWATGDFVHALYEATQSTGTSSYRKLLEKVTYNWSMAKWLTYLYNQKEDIALNRQPDENYAREILQLFSMGLVCLNMDGTPVVDAQGIPVPTYTAEDIPECARFFTGLNDPVQPQYSAFTSMASSWHDINAKTLFKYPGGSAVALPARHNGGSINERAKSLESYTVTVVDANTFTVQTSTIEMAGASRESYTSRHMAYYTDSSYNTPITASATRLSSSDTVTITKSAHGLTNGQVIYHKHPIEIDIDAMLDHIFNHPTTPVYISKSLIKFFVTSNPSPQYIRRVSEKFVDNGSGVRGDLAAVIKAILIDREAIIPFGINPNNHGRLLNPLERVLKVANCLRSDIIHVNTDGVLSRNDYITYGVIRNKPRTLQEYNGCCASWLSGLMQFQNTPSVFNFYRPGYTPPSTTLGTIGLTAPESQVINTECEIVWMNMVDAMCDYASQSANTTTAHTNYIAYSYEGILDPRNGQGRHPGVQFVTSNFTCTAKTATTLEFTGNVSVPYSSNFGNLGQIWVNRTNNYRIGTPNEVGATYANITAGTGTKVVSLTGLTTTVTDNFTVGDLVDSPAALYTGHFGFPTRQVVTGGGQAGTRNDQPYIPFLYKAALNLPDSAANPTQPEMDVAINYLEFILMSRPISTELRAIMSSAATQAVTLPTNFVPCTDPLTVNHYNNFRWSYNQVRIRRMLAMLLISPEFLVQY